jgi:peptidoglycan/LPS O-acetylase OafA/YrhL
VRPQFVGYLNILHLDRQFLQAVSRREVPFGGITRPVLFSGAGCVLVPYSLVFGAFLRTSFCQPVIRATLPGRVPPVVHAVSMSNIRDSPLLSSAVLPPSPSPARQGAISSVHLNAIRGAAALVVLLGHTRSLFFSSLTAADHVSITSHSVRQSASSGAGPITMGNEAVIIFFVLSGYLVGGSTIRDLKNGRWSWKKYLVLRLTRLWVVLLPALLFGIAVDQGGLHMFQGTHSVYTGPPGLCLVPCNIADRVSPAIVAGNALFLQKIFVNTAGSNSALWSLANEFWYYLAFPICLLAAQKDRPLLRRAFYLALLLSIAALVGQEIVLLFFVWSLGALISVLPLKMPRSARKFGAFGFTALFLVVVLLVRRAHLSLHSAEWMIAVWFAVVLYMVLHRTEPARASIYKSVADFFSRISYTLYLVHLPLAVFLCACINTPWHQWGKEPSQLAMFLLLNVVLVFFSYTFYLLFEANTDRIRRVLFYGRIPELHLPRVQTERRTPPVVPERDVSIGWQQR